MIVPGISESWLSFELQSLVLCTPVQTKALQAPEHHGARCRAQRHGPAGGAVWDTDT